MNHKLNCLIEMAKRDKKTYSTILPNIYGDGYTRWNVEYKKDTSVEISATILDKVI